MNNQLLIKRNNIKIFGNGDETIFFLHGYPPSRASISKAVLVCTLFI
jgi:hypothetical protein